MGPWFTDVDENESEDAAEGEDVDYILSHMQRVQSRANEVLRAAWCDVAEAMRVLQDEQRLHHSIQAGDDPIAAELYQELLLNGTSSF